MTPLWILAATITPIVLVLGREAAGCRTLGYTQSLLLFAVPSAAIALSLATDRRVRGEVAWPALASTVLAWTAVGWLLDLTLAATFFRFPNRDSVCGWELPGFDLRCGDTVPVPAEEFAFYLLGFLVAVLSYLWLDRHVFAARRIEATARSPRSCGLHAPTASLGVLALGAAWAVHGEVPGYTLFLVVAVLVPNCWLVPRALPFVNRRALAATMVVLVAIAAIWEVGLALPNGWWAYEPGQVIGWIETPWSRVPFEAVAVWLSWPWTTIATYEALRARRAGARRVAPAAASMLAVAE